MPDRAFRRLDLGQYHRREDVLTNKKMPDRAFRLLFTVLAQLARRRLLTNKKMPDRAFRQLRGLECFPHIHITADKQKNARQGISTVEAGSSGGIAAIAADKQKNARQGISTGTPWSSARQPGLSS